MLARNLRVDRRLFDQVIASGRSRYDGPYAVRTLPLADAALPSRFAFAVPKKSVPLAVRRNLLRRRVRAIIQKNQSLMKPGFAHILFLKRELLDLTPDALESVILKLL